MANSYFQFKQFTVEQDLAGMKVGTDGVLLGAWATCNHAKTILDVGTGTGLIALMCAQRNNVAQVDAIEIEGKACIQAKKNVKNSPWRERIEVIHDSLQNYSKICSKKYDLIISNPPFFNNSLKNNCQQKSLARHTDSLNYIDLIKGAKQLLSDNGVFSVVLPFDVKDTFEEMAMSNQVFLNRILKVKPTPSKQEKRILMELSLQKQTLKEEVMIVEEFGRHGYSDSYKKLTQDFYIKF